MGTGRNTFASRATAAAACKSAALARVGMHLDDAANGVFLPAARRSPNPGGALVHATVHTRKYFDYINSMLGHVTTQVEVRSILEGIRKQLLKGVKLQ